MAREALAEIPGVHVGCSEMFFLNGFPQAIAKEQHMILVAAPMVKLAPVALQASGVPWFDTGWLHFLVLVFI